MSEGVQVEIAENGDKVTRFDGREISRETAERKLAEMLLEALRNDGGDAWMGELSEFDNEVVLDGHFDLGKAGLAFVAALRTAAP
jgi:hypothetical protein